MHNFFFVHFFRLKLWHVMASSTTPQLSPKAKKPKLVLKLNTDTSDSPTAPTPKISHMTPSYASVAKRGYIPNPPTPTPVFDDR